MKTAKDCAIHDIKEELKSEKKPFIDFRIYLNPVMRQLIKAYKTEQRRLTKKIRK